MGSLSLQLRLEPSRWGWGCCGPTTCGAVGTVEESGRLTGLGLVPPDGPLVATVLLAGGTIIQYEVGEAHLLQDPAEYIMKNDGLEEA